MAIFSRNKGAEAALAAQTEAAYDELGRLALDGVIPIGDVQWRSNVKVAGHEPADVLDLDRLDLGRNALGRHAPGGRRLQPAEGGEGAMGVQGAG